MKPLPRLAVLAAAFATAASLRAAVAISEILYQPAGIPESVALEFIELHNPDAAPVSLTGWRFDNGVTFAFAPGTAIPGGGWLVVAANVAAFQAAHPGVPNVVGGWTGSLSNSGEEVRLVNEAGVTQDAVRYADEGDWALRYRETTWGGWAWSSAASGGGRSLELRNAALDNACGQNWGASAAAGGTPGAVNSLATADIAPLIRKVAHTPAVPKPADSVIISCELTDETPAFGLSARLHWRDGTGAFEDVPMAAEGVNRFTATLGPRGNLTIIEFYISATDGTNTRTWPAPTTEGQNANCQYQVTSEAATTDSVYRLVLTGAENAAFNAVAANSDRQFNHTLVVTRGGESSIRYRSSMRIRGNSSRNYQFRPLRVSVPGDDPWDGVTAFNVNPRSPYLQFLGSRLFQAAGLRTGDAIPVELRRNGVEQTTSTGLSPDYGKWVRVEDFNSDMVDQHWPEASGGNIYKKGRPDRYWRNTGWVVPPNSDGLLDGWGKQNNGAANDWSDLTGFFATVQSVTAPHFPGAPANDSAASTGSPTTTIGAWNGGALTAPQVSTLETVAELDQWARWLAVMTILQDLETNLSNGEDDDYAVYFAPAAGGQRRMHLVAHDLDSILGQGDSSGPFNSRGLYDMTATGSIFRPLLPLIGNSTTTGNAVFRTKYLTAIRELYGSAFDANTAGNPNPAFHTFVDNHLAGWVPAAARGDLKTFATNRQAYLLGLIGSGAITPVPPTSAATFTSGTGAVVIHEVLAKNVAAVNVGGAFPDIIELRNTTGAAVDLTGHSLTDDPALPAKFVFPAGTTIAAGGFLVLYADGAAGAGHVSFALADEGERVRLHAPAANGGALLDSIEFGPQPADFSIGRMEAAPSTWTLCTPTIGAANSAASLDPPVGIRINEWLGNPDYQFDDDFLELHNPGALPVALAGMSLTDDFINYPTRSVFPPLSFIGPGAFLYLTAKGSDATPGDATELPFRIDGTASWLALIGQNGATADVVDIVAQGSDAPQGRTPDAAAATTIFTLPAALGTPGISNATPPANVLALMNGLRVTEILFKPDNLEFIELRNIGATTLDLAGVRFTKGITYTFAPGATLAPGAFVVICKDRAAFLAQFGASVPLAAGQFTGSLSNTGEFVAFRPPAPWDAYILNFEYDAAWYPASGNGYALTVNDAVSARPNDWDEPTTWSASPVLYGSPGNDGPPAINSPLTAAGIAGEPFQYQITATKYVTSYNAAPLPPGLSFNAETGLISGTPTAVGVFQITIGVANPAGSDSRTLTLTVASSGPLAGFAWSAIPSPRFDDVPISATLIARDAQGRTVTSFQGSVPVSAAVQGGAAGTAVVLTEAGQNTPDYFELQNVGTQAVNTAGWFVVCNNGTSGDPNAAHTLTWPLPASLAAGQVLHSTDSSTENFFGENIFWTTAVPGWVMLVDAAGSIRDFAAWGYSEAQIASISVVKNGFTLNPAAQGAWTGPGVPAATASTSHLRIGDQDHHNATDWTAAAPSRGTQNAGLTVPFTGGSAPLPTAPASVALTDGVWSGSLTIDGIAADVRVTANDGAGHFGVTNSFALTTLVPPVITSPASALAVAGQPFAFQVLASNLPSSFGATNLPADLAIDPGTGRISGTPAAPGTSSITLSATNAAGTGNAPFSLEVQADTDADGMGDAWETAHGLNPASPADAALDLDGDGQANRAEWLAGTAPDDPAARFMILSHTPVGGDLLLTWSSVPGKLYRVLTRADLAPGSWIDLTPAPIVATDAATTWTHVGGAANPPRYYSIHVLP